MDNDKIANPTKYYHHPNEVKDDPELSTDEKIILFENWLDDIKLKLIAEEENMPCTLEAPKYYIKEINDLLTDYKNHL
ncbi:MAG TPA: hypothetical protein PK657_03955 [Legionella sp.]|nr:hypothetical protein [Legionella sp.]